MAENETIIERELAMLATAEAATEKLRQMVHGDESTVVQVDSGPLPSLRKWQADSADFLASAVKEDQLQAALKTQSEEIIRSRLGEQILNKVNENRSWIYPWGGRGVTVLGDSISHMAFSREAFKSNWTNILKRCINAEFDKSSYGFVSLLPTLGSGATLSREIHSVTRTGAWTELTTSDCEWSLSGFALQSSTVGDTLDIVVPTFQRHFGVWYHSFVGGGRFEVYVNDELKATVSTDGTAGSTRTSGLNIGRLDMIDNGKGACKLGRKLTVTGTFYSCDFLGDCMKELGDADVIEASKLTCR